MAKLILDNLKEFNTYEGKTLPAGEWITITQEMINDFAKATLDFQWIHVDVEKATQYSPFKKPVAHGFMSVSLLSKMLGDLIQIKSVKMGVNYGLNKVRFPNAVLVDSKLRLHGKVAAIEDYAENGVKVTWLCSVEIEGADKPACVAEFISIMFE
ncbi:MaoC family dehydratase [Maribacter arcticus]|uniref:Acyl dehydratase n=1 Tax=Maribacter arcticus TaxID=561365 RepID=A0A1T5CPJ9_9FLAO|nr:MaoC family dehydratase [Maribacter arcticus]SKB61382.1 Acyl dehydratase [Maribacter arcticus]